MQYEKLLGKTVLVLCSNYFYTGVLESIEHDVIWISAPSIVYETGDFKACAWADAQRLPFEEIQIERSSIESMGAVVWGAACL